MIKTLEAVMAIMILLMFMITLFNSYTKNDYRENIITDKISEVISLKAKEDSFRKMVSSDNAAAIYNSLYTYMDTNFSIVLCDFLENQENCNNFGDAVPSKSALYVVNYYFYDSNKTLNILIWS